jgi:GntR family transcriptional regulator/MocR family aminotransferase
MSDRGSCMLDQLALATLLTTGRYDRHLRRMRTVYAARRTALTDAFARHAPRVQLTGLAADSTLSRLCHPAPTRRP